MIKNNECYKNNDEMSFPLNLIFDSLYCENASKCIFNNLIYFICLIFFLNAFANEGECMSLEGKKSQMEMSRGKRPCGMIFLNTHIQSKSSIEETEDLSSDVSVSGLFVGEDSLVGGNNQMTELSRGKNVAGPLLEVFKSQIVSRTDNSAFVDSADQFNNDLLGSVIINDFELSDVAVDLHELEELDNQF